jgi:hypothetical protein
MTEKGWSHCFSAGAKGTAELSKKKFLAIAGLSCLLFFFWNQQTLNIPLGTPGVFRSRLAY